MLRATLGGDDPLAGFRIDGAAVLAAYQAANRDYDQPEVYVLDYGITRIFDDGSSLHLVHQIIKLQSEEAVDAQGEFAPPGDAAMLKLHTNQGGRHASRARPHRGQGHDLAARTSRSATTSSTSTSARSSRRKTSSARCSAIASTSRASRRRSIAASSCSCTPEGMSPLIDPRGPLPEATVEHRNGLVVRKWLVSESRPRMQEPLASSPREWLPSMNYGVGASWDAYRDAILDGLADRDVTDPEAVRLVLDILGDDVDASDETKAKKLYSWVLENIEATDALLAEASQMIASRAGSRARVLHYMLGIANVPSDLVLVRPFANDQTPSELPDEETYTSVLVRLGDERSPTFIATSQRGTPFGYVPPLLRGQDALVLRRGAGKIRVPSESRIPDRRTIAVDVALAADGTAEVSVTETFTGVSAISWRGELEQIPDAVLEQRFEEAYAARIIPGASLTSLRITGRDDPEAPLVLTYSVAVPEVGHREGNDRIIPAMFPTQLASGYAQPATRTTPQLVAPLDVETTIRIRAPEGASFPTIPERVVARRSRPRGVHVRRTRRRAHARALARGPHPARARAGGGVCGSGAVLPAGRSRRGTRDSIAFSVTRALPSPLFFGRAGRVKDCLWAPRAEACALIASFVVLSGMPAESKATSGHPGLKPGAANQVISRSKSARTGRTRSRRTAWLAGAITADFARAESSRLRRPSRASPPLSRGGL